MREFSWGNIASTEIKENFELGKWDTLVVGNLRSYGDVCTSKHGVIKNKNNKILNLDIENEEILVESGATIEDVLEHIVPKGFFVKAMPGTKFVSIGGCVANDVHGKDHHLNGSFGNSIMMLELIRDGKVIKCSHHENSNLFYSTIGGIGLTGYISKVLLKIEKVSSSFIKKETIKFKTINEFLTLSDESANYDYTVAWVDNFSYSPNRLQGLFYRGHFEKTNRYNFKRKRQFRLFRLLPSWIINNISIKVFNNLMFNMKLQKNSFQTVHFDKFFFPLDSIAKWNDIYGKKGFFQFQCVIPKSKVEDALPRVLELAKSQGSFLSVLKSFGAIKSLGDFSFPIEGVTLALDFKNLGTRTEILIKKLNELVAEVDGKIYLAKDMFLTKEQFNRIYNSTNLLEIKQHSLSSDLFERCISREIR